MYQIIHVYNVYPKKTAHNVLYDILADNLRYGNDKLGIFLAKNDFFVPLFLPYDKKTAIPKKNANYTCEKCRA